MLVYHTPLYCTSLAVHTVRSSNSFVCGNMCSAGVVSVCKTASRFLDVILPPPSVLKGFGNSVRLITSKNATNRPTAMPVAPSISHTCTQQKTQSKRYNQKIHGAPATLWSCANKRRFGSKQEQAHLAPADNSQLLRPSLGALTFLCRYKEWSTTTKGSLQLRHKLSIYGAHAKAVTVTLCAGCFKTLQTTHLPSEDFREGPRAAGLQVCVYHHPQSALIGGPAELEACCKVLRGHVNTCTAKNMQRGQGGACAALYRQNTCAWPLNMRPAARFSGDTSTTAKPRGWRGGVGGSMSSRHRGQVQAVCLSSCCQCFATQTVNPTCLQQGSGESVT